MKSTFLKVFSLALLVSSLSLYHKAFAQTLDPALGTVSVTPSSAIAQGNVGANLVIQVNVGPTGSVTTAPAGSLGIQISFPPEVVPFPATAAAVNPGSFADKFTWAYNSGTNTLTGTILGETIDISDDGTITIDIQGITITGAANIITNLIYPLTTGPYPGNDTNNDGFTLPVSVVANPSPVTLVSFNATKEGQAAVLSWSTSEETNSDRFEIEHSLNAKNWLKIGTVLSKGDSKDLERYLFTDTNPANGTNFYRLRMVDRDGTFAYTRAKSLEFDIKIETALYPNPVSDKLLIKVQDMTKIKSVSLLNLQGKVVLESNTVPTNGLDVMNLPTGLYVVQVVNINGSVNSFKVMKN